MPLTDERSEFQFICYLPAYLASIGVILPVILSLDVIFYWMSEQSADTLFSLVLQYEYIIKILAISGFLSSLMVRYLDKDEENVFRMSMRLLSIFSIATMGLLLVIMLVGVPYPRISTILALLYISLVIIVSFYCGYSVLCGKAMIIITISAILLMAECLINITEMAYSSAIFLICSILLLQYEGVVKQRNAFIERMKGMQKHINPVFWDRVMLCLLIIILTPFLTLLFANLASYISPFLTEALRTSIEFKYGFKFAIVVFIAMFLVLFPKRIFTDIFYKVTHGGGDKVEK